MRESGVGKIVSSLRKHKNPKISQLCIKLREKWIEVAVSYLSIIISHLELVNRYLHYVCVCYREMKQEKLEGNWKPFLQSFQRLQEMVSKVYRFYFSDATNGLSLLFDFLAIIRITSFTKDSGCCGRFNA